MKILMVVTSHDELGTTGKKTGFWLEEFAAPYYTFLEAGAEVTVASPKGGAPPVDPKSDLPENVTEYTRRFTNDPEAQSALANSLRLEDVTADRFDAVFFPGGHGPLWDLAGNATSVALIEAFIQADKPVGAVCHAPAVLLNVRDSGGEYFVKGRHVTGFTNAEEEAVGLTEVVPFLLENRLTLRDAVFSHAPMWTAYVQVDGKLVTGQNPASSKAAAEELVQLLRQG